MEPFLFAELVGRDARLFVRSLILQAKKFFVFIIGCELIIQIVLFASDGALTTGNKRRVQIKPTFCIELFSPVLGSIGELLVVEWLEKEIENAFLFGV